MLPSKYAVDATPVSSPASDGVELTTKYAVKRAPPVARGLVG
jgi:hypothetical protein